MRLDAFLMLASGIFYLLCAYFVWKKMRQENSELIKALFAFLVYQTIGMFFMGLQMYTMNPLYAKISSLAILVGSAYMLKFPFSVFSAWTRKILFMLTLVGSIALFAWFMQTPALQMALMKFSLWYDLAVNGVVVGGTIIVFGVRNAMYRVKALGGGSGVVSCCVVANASMLGGAVLASSFFQFLAPLLILGALFIGKRASRA